MVNTNISESEKIAANTRVEKIVIKFEPPCTEYIVLHSVCHYTIFSTDHLSVTILHAFFQIMERTFSFIDTLG